MNLFIMTSQVKELVKKYVSFDIEDLVEYTDGMMPEEIDGELLRSYFIVYNEGINMIWDNLVNNYPKYRTMELTEDVKIYIEEALEEVDFDKIFIMIIMDIKKSLKL